MAEIRLVAVDEDGTFLRDHVYYDQRRFSRLMARMREAGVRFVVATGNQCYQVQSLFEDYVDEIGIVSANGAYVLDGREPVFAAQADQETVTRVIDYVHARPQTPFSMLGVDAAYVERGTSRAFFEEMSCYCTRQYWVDDFRMVDDQIFMFSSVVEEERVADEIEYFRGAVAGAMDVVGSGEGYFDVVCPNVNKATGLAHLLDRWHLSLAQVVAFGDSDNDLEMIKAAGIGYAMGNAPDNVKAAADRIAPPNDEDGVLQVLEELFS